jgi:3-deoxy-manno-octulosonate cytidylyltransferase (CMP-KDO synthetase)
MILENCKTGTDRVAVAVDSPLYLRNMALKKADIFVNIQGDEPLINPEAIDTLIDHFDDSIGVAGAYTTLEETYKLHDNNVVKVVLDKSYNALYYSRWPIPYNQKDNIVPYQQLGLYAFNRKMLEKFTSLPRGVLEKSEGVEMLRYLENGYNVKMVKVEDEGLSVDTPEDLQIVEAHLNGYN